MGDERADFDLFISYAGEDRDAFVRPLADKLARFGVRVWFDDFALSVGDSLSGAIDRGLSSSSYGLVVLSQSFLGKGWPEYELRSLLAREVGQEKVILPIWHDLDRSDLLKFSPFLADKVALRADELTTVQLCVAIIDVVRPDLAEKVQRRAAFLSLKAEKTPVDPRILKFGPPRHETLPLNLISRVRLIRAALLSVYPHSMEFWIDGFRGDAHPSREIRIWEHIASCFLEYIQITPLSREQNESVWNVVLALSLGVPISEAVSKAGDLPEDAEEKIEGLWSYPVPVYDVQDQEFPRHYEVDPEAEDRLKQFDRETFPYDVPDDLIRELISTDEEDV